ncbi:MAG: hypothetical protein J6Y91_01360 [Alphaproteobacteria bacterium]|nr:hypothetical protein [Alphaproteobacteria bacterium]
MKLKSLFSKVSDFLSSDGNWGKGAIKGTYNIPYNLQWLIKVLVVLLLLVVLPFVLIFWLCGKLLDALIWVAPFIGKAWNWLWRKIRAFFKWLGLLLLAFLLWLWSFFARKPQEKKPRENQKSSKWWLWLLLLLLLLLLGLGLFRMCGSCSSDNGQNQALSAPIALYDTSFDRVVVARAYLDGVQPAVTNDRILVGLKYVNGEPLEPLKDVNFGDQAYNQAIVQIADDWKPVVVESLKPDLQLDEQQMVTITLAAMRMGPNGFPRSTFCQKVNEGKFDEATRWLCLQKADGSRRPMGYEAQRYFYVLKLLWTKQISVAEMLDLPMFSYKTLSDADLASDVLTGEARQKLHRGNYLTPRQALGL